MTDKATTTNLIACALGTVIGVMTFERWLAVISLVAVLFTTWHAWRHRNRMYKLASEKDDRDEHEKLLH